MSSCKLQIEILRNCGDGHDRVVTKNIRNKFLYLHAERRSKLHVRVRWRHLWNTVGESQYYYQGRDITVRSGKCGLQYTV
jgi:hypothetical protein